MEKRKIFESAVRLCYDMQDRITAALEKLEMNSAMKDRSADPKQTSENKSAPPGRSAIFKEDLWEYGETGSSVLTGGGGRSRAIENGHIFEKGGVNVSDVSGRFTEEMARSQPGKSNRFRATGISLVLHPRNPHLPTVHANFRVIKRITERGEVDSMWFGGGADLTPYVLYDEDARHFHSVFRDLCAKHDVASYDQMKAACDIYFYLPHRQEARGIGGLFYDYKEDRPEEWLSFMKQAGDAFLDAYLPLVQRRSEMPYSEAEREFQLYRRGRYVEFNLIHDRGTLFGLRTGGRIESVLMSLPSPVVWKYNYDPLLDATLPDDLKKRVSELYAVLKKPRDWISA